MRGIGTALFQGFALVLTTSIADAADLRVLSVGSVQIAAKALAADFTTATGQPVGLTIVAPSEIGQKLAGATAHRFKFGYRTGQETQGRNPRDRIGAPPVKPQSGGQRGQRQLVATQRSLKRIVLNPLD